MAQGPHYKFYDDFSGGLNDTVSAIRTSPREASIARNLDLSRDGAATRRRGSALKNTSSQRTGEIGMIYQFRPAAGGPKLLIAHDDAIEEWDGANGWTSLVSGLTGIDKIVLPVPYRYFCYLFNNVDDSMIYWPDAPGSPDIFKPGAPAPPAPTDNSNIAGSVGAAGEKFLVRVRYVSIIDDIDFGEPSPELEVTLVAGGGRKINIPSFVAGGGPLNYRIGQLLIERTTAGSSPGGTFFLDGYVAIGTATYDIVQSDTDLLENEQMPDPGFRHPMPKLWPAIEYKNRVVGADLTDFGLIRWSEIDEFGLLPNSFPELNTHYLDLEDGSDAPVMVLKLGEFLVWYCGKSVHLMHIDEGGISDVRRITGHDLGFPSARGGLELPNLGHVVYTFSGPYFFDAQRFIPIGERIEATIGTVPKGQLANMFVIHRPQEDRRQVHFVVPTSGQAKNVQALKYHYRRITLNPEGFPTAHAWTIDDKFEAKSGAIVRDATNTVTEYFGDYSGRIYQRDFGDADAQHPGGASQIEGEYRTGWLDCDLPHQVKFFEDVWLFVAGSGPNMIQLTWETGFGRGPSGSASMMLAGDQALWDSAVWDTAVWALGENAVRHAKVGQNGVGAWGRYIRFRWANYNANEPWQVLGLMLKYSIDRDRDDASPL